MSSADDAVTALVLPHHMGSSRCLSLSRTNCDCLLAPQVKTALEQQSGSPPTDEEVLTELLAKSMVEKDAIRSGMAAAKQAAEEKAAAEAAAAAEQAAGAEAEAPAADDAAAAE